MIVNEIFSSIEGEGKRTGELATFVRFAGCNLCCSYCDTKYALNVNAGVDMSVDDIYETILTFGNSNVTITGGEPLLQKDMLELVSILSSSNFEVNIETNGSIDVSPYLDIDKCFLTVDYKLPSSGCSEFMLPQNFTQLRASDVIKCVVSESDLSMLKYVLGLNENHAYFYISPVFGKIEPVLIVDEMKRLTKTCSMSKVRVQVQLHKIIWNPDVRGV